MNKNSVARDEWSITFLFGRTDFNDNSSRFAKYLDVSFSKMGKVTGAKVSVFLLEHTRLLLAESELSKNFHIFSLVFAGLKNLGKLSDFGLENCSRFAGYSKPEVKRQEEEFSKLISAFKVIGFRENEMDTIYRILAGILNLLEIDFKATLAKDNTDGAEVVNPKSGEGPIQVKKFWMLDQFKFTYNRFDLVQIGKSSLVTIALSLDYESELLPVVESVILASRNYKS